MSSNLNIPNSITFVRGLLIIPFVYFLLIQNMGYSLALFLTFFALDIMDGNLARILDQQTSFGNNFDFAVDGIGYIAAGVILVLLGKISIIFIILGIVCIGIKSIIVGYGFKKNNKLIHHRYDKFEGLFASILIVLFIIGSGTTVFLAYVILFLMYVCLGYLGYYTLKMKRHVRKSKKSSGKRSVVKRKIKLKILGIR